MSCCSSPKTIKYLAFMVDSDTQHEEKEEKNLSPQSSPKLPEEVHGAPPESFVAQLAETMAGIKTEQGMAEFWLEVIKEVSLFAFAQL